MCIHDLHVNSNVASVSRAPVTIIMYHVYEKTYGLINVCQVDSLRHAETNSKKLCFSSKISRKYDIIMHLHCPMRKHNGQG